MGDDWMRIIKLIFFDESNAEPRWIVRFLGSD